MGRSETFWARYGPYMALGVALVATLGSLYYGEILGLAPCLLCWYQRILMFPLTVILLTGILRGDERASDYVLPFSVAGMGVSLYHYLVQMGVFAHPAACSIGVPCDVVTLSYLGFITIPLMSFAAFAFITLVMALGRWAGARTDASPSEEAAG